MGLDLKNRTMNTIKTPFRMVGHTIEATKDALVSTLKCPVGFFKTLGDTLQNSRDVFKKIPTKDGKRYQKMLKTTGKLIISPAVAAGVFLEGWVRSLVTPPIHLLEDYRDIGANFVINQGKVFKMVANAADHQSHGSELPPDRKTPARGDHCISGWRSKKAA